MKSPNTLQFSKVLLLLALLTISCKKTPDDNPGKNSDKISEEVRASLEGEIVYYKFPSIFKSIAKQGGAGSLIGSNASGQNGLKWSPDGSKIAYVKFDGSTTNWSLVICSKEGVPEHEWNLEMPFDGFRGISWSPDGSTVAALSNTGTKIYYIEVATGKSRITELASRAGYFYSSIAWCLKGNKIAIAEAISTFNGGEGNKYIWMMDAFENDPRKDPNSLLVTNNDPLITTIEYLDWNVDGSMLVYSGGGPSPIYIVNSSGSGNQKIVLKDSSKKLIGFAPCWMSNSNQIIYIGITGVNGSSLIFGLFVTDINRSYSVDINISGLYPDCY